MRSEFEASDTVARGAEGTTVPTTPNRFAPGRLEGNWAVRLAVNLGGACIAAMFARRYILFHLHSHRPIGIAFFVQQLWIMAAFLLRRPHRVVSRRGGDWLLAFCGTFGGVLLSQNGAHLRWGLDIGLLLQIVGVAISVSALIALGRSFGSVAADRGMVQRGPYAVVRHPLYAGYLLLLIGYLVQSISVWNVIVVVLVVGCDVGRALAEERLLATTAAYGDYRRRVRWRLFPAVW